MADIDAIRERSLGKFPSLSHLGLPPAEPFSPALLREGPALRELQGRVDRREWVQVRRGWWVTTRDWTALTADQRHAAAAHAVARGSDQPLVFSHVTAAVLWGLPVIGQGDSRIHVAAGPSQGQRKGLVRHRSSREPEPVQLQGLQVTSPVRTVVDLARMDFYSGLAAADQGLRLGMFTFEELDAEVAAIPAHGNGRPRAQTMAMLADPLAMTAGESYSRARMYAHGLPRPTLQVDLSDDLGFIGLGDFGWRGKKPRTWGVVGEFDGLMKYKIGPNQNPEAAAARLTSEKRREDRIRRQGILVARWVWADVHGGDALLHTLAAVGIMPGDRSLWLPPTLAA